MTIVKVTEMQYEIVYDSLSFTQACMMATTIFLWLRVSSMHEKYKTPLAISGLVTFIAAFHYSRIFKSWCDAYEYGEAVELDDGTFDIQAPQPTGTPFNDAYRYMDWLQTVPLLLIEIVLVMKLDRETTFKKSVSLGVSSALMIIVGYPGELILEEENLNKRWGFWVAAMVPFLYIVYELTVGLSGALEEETDARIKSKIRTAQLVTVVSWLTYPIVYVFPMLGADGATTVVGIQIGYCVSDIISKCGVGFLIYKITLAKSNAALKGASEDSPLVVEKSTS